MLSIDPLMFFTIVVASTMCFFHYYDLYKENRNKGINKITPANLKMDFKVDFNTIEGKARVSYTEQEKAEVAKLIDIFKHQYSHYPQTRYDVQILHCINRMRNKTALTYNFEFQN